MKGVHHFATVDEYNELAGQKTLHPLVSVLDFSQLVIPDPQARRNMLRCFSFGFYAVFFKKGKYCDIHYGRNKYDYQDGTLVFIAPDQVINIEYGEEYVPGGWGLLFHPDLLRGTALASIMKDYSFFAYQSNEALHLSEREKQIVLECFEKIEFELQQNIDKHSKKLIVSNIELLLNYCVRFYDRQFVTREVANSGVLEKFEHLLHDYFRSGQAMEAGIPGVAWFAGQLHLSPNYFGDLVRKDTGRSAQDYIHAKLIDLAKEKIFDSAKSVSEVAYELGFKYPQHFTRFFKQHVGFTPNEYRSSLN
jgi:AraC-like DNA-binding protein